MKRVLVIIGIVVFGLSFKGFSQNIPSGTFNLLVGPSFHRGFGGMLTGEYEIQMLEDNLTIGPKIGIGMSRYPFANYNINGYYTHNTYRSGLVVHPGVVAHYYFDWLIDDMPSRFDLFAKASAGFWFVMDGDLRTQRNYTPFTFGLFAGGRYHFESDWSFYLALGFGTSYANLGLSKSF
jgi:hypothetical protein